MLTFIGDVVLHVPFLDAVTEVFGAGSFDVVVRPPVDQVICEHSRIRRIFVFSCPWPWAGSSRWAKWLMHWTKGSIRWFRLLMLLRKERYDMAIVTHRHEMSSLTAFLSGAGVTTGWATQGDRFLDEPLYFVESDRKRHASEYPVQLLDYLGIPSVPWERLPVAEMDFQRGRSLVEDIVNSQKFAGAKTIAVHPGAGSRNKVWPWENFSSLINELIEKSHFVILLGSEKEKDLCTEIEKSISYPLKMKNFCRHLNIGELAGVISSVDIYVGNDSGPSHMAGALGVGVYAIFGPSDPGIWAPRGPGVHVIHMTEDLFRSDRSVRNVLSAMGYAGERAKENEKPDPRAIG
jgi:ADP-heptose:LPS heptosyltransferase